MSIVTMTAQQIAEKRARLNGELQSLNDEEARRSSLAPEHLLAEELHNSMCRWNHTDGCSWFYEISNGVVDWHGHAHSRWLQNAKSLMETLHGFDISDIVSVVSAVRSFG